MSAHPSVLIPHSASERAGLRCARRHNRKDERMDWKDIDRLRDPGFSEARRGYDRHEVDRLLGALVDWLETDAARDLGDLAVKRKLEFVGKSAARILLTTEEESAQLRRLTEEECAELRSEAEAASLSVRQLADEYAAEVRAKADEDARQAREAAHADAGQIIEEGERRRAEIEAVVRELEARRDGTIQELDRLRAHLSSTLGTHEPDPPHERDADKRGAESKKAKVADAAAKA
jgi:cell division septum initiation protein DivIVA